MSQPCYSFTNGALSKPDLGQCKAVQDGYVDETYIASNYGGFVNVRITKSYALIQSDIYV